MHKKRQIVMGFLAVMMCFSMSGCGSGIVLNQEENDLIAQYAANAILQNDKNYEDRFVVDSTTQEASTTQPEQQTTTTESATPSESDTKSQKEAEQTTQGELKPSLSKVSSFLNLSLQYKGCKVASHYEDGNQSSLPVEASSGNKLLILKFKIKNTSSTTNQVDMLSSKLSYDLQLGTEKLQPQLTVLEDDLTTYQGSLKKHASKNVVLIFEIPKKSANHPTGTLEISNGDEATTLEIQ